VECNWKMKLEKKKDISEYLIDIKKKGFRCLKCGNEWIPRKKNSLPRVCPKCRSYKWDEPKEIRLELPDIK